MRSTQNKVFSLLFVFLFNLAILGASIFSVSGKPKTLHAAPNCSIPTVPTFPSKTGFYVLAYDNDEEASFNLGSQYNATVDRLVLATANVPDSLVVILADLGGEADTHMIVATNGTRTQLDCLPDPSGVLDPEIQELDTADGESIGDFLAWGINTFKPNGNIHFSYIGHGNPVSPHTVPPIYELIESGEATSTTAKTIQKSVDGLSPLPSRLGANPSFTDHHAPTKGKLSLITPYAIATALSRITNDGANPIDSVDLLHCFAASIDELHEIAPHTKGMVASPNYAFFDPEMPGVGFEQSTLNDVVLTYDSFHPPTGHPHIIMGIESDTIIDTVNQWNEVSAELMKEFVGDAQLTSDNLIKAYRDSVHYDTTVCEEERDWELGPPDALVDLKSFAIELQAYYGPTSPSPNPNLVTALMAVENNLEGSITNTAVQNGTPYFDQDSPQVWTFLAGESGVSLFTPLELTYINETPYLPWQTLWYTDTTSYQLPQDVQITNPNPFKFITSATDPTWADVLSEFWKFNEMQPGRDVGTFFCPTELVTMSDSASDLEAGIEVEKADELKHGDTFSVTISMLNSDFAPASNPVLIFTPHDDPDPTPWLTLVETDQPRVCTETDQSVRCELGSIGEGVSIKIKLIYKLGDEVPVSELSAKIKVFSDNFDPDPTNNQLSQLITIGPAEPPDEMLFLPIVNR